jgi:2-dehydro-3-deoxygalactonokinase
MKIGQEAAFIGCDWGSSNFRLALLAENGLPLAEFADDGGIVSLRKNGAGALELMNHLHKGLTSLALVSGRNPDALPLFISGMAGSSIGIVEVPYAPVPFALDGSDAKVHELSPLLGIPNKVVVLSGVCTHDDVMRGEETESMGLLSAAGAQDAFLILPGTHSKHIEVISGKIETFQTYMTGELFNVISSQTILAKSLEDPSMDPFDDHGRRCFIDGLSLSANQGLLHSLFTLRSRTLVDMMPVRGNIHRLSGLLIGSELRCINVPRGGTIILGGSGTIRDRYRLALQEIFESPVIFDLPSEDQRNAVWRGQAVFYRKTKQY